MSGEQSTAQKLFKSSVSRTLLMVANIGVSFFMTPFIIGKLGDEWYGIWVILGTMVGYYYLIDMGMATAVTRYMSHYIAKKETESANRVINTSLVIYCLMAAVIILATVVIGYMAEYLVTDPGKLYIIRTSILVIGLNLAIEFPLKAFSGIIGAYVRYDLLAYGHFFTLVLNTALTVFFLNRGHGVLTLFIIVFVCNQISNLIFYFVSRRLFKGMRIGLKYFEREKVRDLFGYSIWSFLNQIGDQVRFKIDSFVIVWLLTAGHVTHYVIGARLAEYFMSLVLRATNMLVPVFTRLHAEGNHEEIRNKLLFMTKVNAVLAVFGGGVIMIVGRPFIARWMGDGYLDAYPVLVVLTISVMVEIIQTPANNILYAISRHKYLAYVNVAEAAVNLVLSIVLIKRYGLIGAAIGTAVPLVISRFFIIPLYAGRCVGLGMSRYYRNLFVTGFYTAAYMAVLFILSRGLLSTPSYASILLVGIASVPVYLVSIMYISFTKSERALIRTMLPLRG
ncbi:MAG TPA: hypothetical protein DCR11_05455 [Deltaproteobacteria bacterium]|nr:hypothetical protein [Deltaproteobacteria bacterium]